MLSLSISVLSPRELSAGSQVMGRAMCVRPFIMRRSAVDAAWTLS